MEITRFSSEEMKKVTLVSLILIFTYNMSFAIPKDSCDKKVTCCADPLPGPFAFSYPKDVGLACPRNYYLNADFFFYETN